MPSSVSFTSFRNSVIELIAPSSLLLTLPVDWLAEFVSETPNRSQGTICLASVTTGLCTV